LRKADQTERKNYYCFCLESQQSKANKSVPFILAELSAGHIATENTIIIKSRSCDDAKAKQAVIYLHLAVIIFSVILSGVGEFQQR
jgi:hypothetical protein